MNANNQFIVITRSSDHKQSALFEKSAARFGMPLVILDGKESFADVDGSIISAIRALEASDKEYAISTDAFDVLVSRWNPAEMIRHIEVAEGNLIVSGEIECWPSGPWCSGYKESPSLWPFICAGQLGGRRDALLNTMREIYNRRGSIVTGGGSQEIMHCMHGDGWPMEIDTQCRIFQCMRGGPAKYVVPSGTFAYNERTDTFPMFLHFNGKAQSPGMDKWAEVFSCSA